MAVRPVLRMGDTRLLRLAEPITVFDSSELEALIQDLWDTMDANCGAGLAAPQIGVNRRIVVFGIEHNERYPNAGPVPRTVLINPQWKPLSDEMENAWEGCLSIPGLRGLVPRYTRIRYTGADLQGQVSTREVSDFHARVVQHECDHLDGILFPRRIRDLRQFGFEEEVQQMLAT
jgi:peptide deformylase